MKIKTMVANTKHISYRQYFHCRLHKWDAACVFIQIPETFIALGYDNNTSDEQQLVNYLCDSLTSTKITYFNFERNQSQTSPSMVIGHRPTK